MDKARQGKVHTERLLVHNEVTPGGHRCQFSEAEAIYEEFIRSIGGKL